MATLSNETFYQKDKQHIFSGHLNLIAGSDLSKKFEGGKEVVGEDWSPAEEEDRHDQDQHVDHLDHQDDGDSDEDDEQVLSKNMILYIQSPSLFPAPC